MIVYLDTSSLVKLYVQEDGSEAVEELVRTSDITAASIVAYAEARSAFARRFREGAFTTEDYGVIKRVFNADWQHYLVIFLSQQISELAGDLSETHSLRDLIQFTWRRHSTSRPCWRQPYCFLPLTAICKKQPIKKEW